MEKKEFTLRGEHLVNVHEYLSGVRLKWDESKGYNLEFARKHDEVIKEIIDTPDSTVKIISGFDDICNCGVCPNKRDACISEGVMKRDHAIAALYEVKIGSEFKSKGLVDLLQRKNVDLILQTIEKEKI